MLKVLADPSWVAYLGSFVVQPILLRYSAHHLASQLIIVSKLSISVLCDLLDADPILLLLLIIESLNSTTDYLLLRDAIGIISGSRLWLLTRGLRHWRGLLGKTLFAFFGSTLGRVRAIATTCVSVARLVRLSGLGLLRL